MAEVAVNFVGVAVAAVAYVVLGFAWYSVFSKQWMKLIGLSEKDVKAGKGKMPVNILISLGAAAVLAYAMSWIVGLAQAETVAEGAVAGILAGIGIAAMAAAPNYAWPGKPLMLYILDQAYVVVGMAVLGALVAVI